MFYKEIETDCIIKSIQLFNRNEHLVEFWRHSLFWMSGSTCFAKLPESENSALTVAKQSDGRRENFHQHTAIDLEK